MIADSYAAAIRDETWIGGVLVDSCLSCGKAQQRGNEIIATDRLRDPALRDACEQESARVRAIVREIRDARVRTVIRATSDEPLTSTIVITIGDLSIVTSPHFALEDLERLRTVPMEDSRPALSDHVPIVWNNGTGAVLMHEAIGHAAEHNHPPVDLPQWLDVQIHFAQRRETFRDIPLQRMSDVTVTQHRAPFRLPQRRVDIHYIASASYEPLTQTITIEAALPRFTFRATRQQIAKSIVGAIGEPIRYPGVICSREGQELFVSSYAPVMVTA